MENKVQTSNQNPSENSKKKDWVLVAIRTLLIAKRTENYVLFKLPNGYSAIINAKFLRKKENENYVYASLPYDYQVKIRQTKLGEDKKWHVIDEQTIFPRQLTWRLHTIEEELKNGNALEDILAYSVVPNDNLPF